MHDAHFKSTSQTLMRHVKITEIYELKTAKQSAFNLWLSNNNVNIPTKQNKMTTVIILTSSVQTNMEGLARH